MDKFKDYMNKTNIVSFDFDDTIYSLQWDPEERDYKRDKNGEIIGVLNPEIAAKIKEYHNNGWKVIIVTTRDEKWKQEVLDFVKKHNLPIEEFHFTNGAWKRNTLKRLGVKVHFDDHKDELKRLFEFLSNLYSMQKQLQYWEHV